jgi:hypothetical protein
MNCRLLIDGETIVHIQPSLQLKIFPFKSNENLSIMQMKAKELPYHSADVVLV